MITSKKILISPIVFLLLLIFSTSSLDIFLNVKIGGFSLRMVLVLIIIFGLITLINSINTDGLKLRMLGLKYFFIWYLIQITFIFNTNILVRNFAYILWLSLYAMFILAFNSYHVGEKTYLKIVKYYIFSFKILSVIGIVQFILGLLGYDFYVSEWWIINKFPRINGFSYEPSYFATYLMLGWSICVYLYRNNSVYIKYFDVNTALILISTTLLLTTSRMCLFLMVILFFQVNITNFFKSLVKLKLNKVSLLILVFMFLVGFYVIVLKWDDYNFLFQGLGIGGLASHSVGNRYKEFMNTIAIFLNSPFIGYSLGGIPSAIAELKGVIIRTQEETKNFEGMSIFAEVLAASGIIGFFFFFMFLRSLFTESKKMIKYTISIRSDLSLIHKALIYSFILELVLLSLNQNILRSYLWIHVAIINFSFYSIVNILSNTNKTDRAV